ncbi:MAG: PAS domain S-box protein [Desulfarculaceae bacterium]|jgi:PAS domain S-box-containing protein
MSKGVKEIAKRWNRRLVILLVGVLIAGAAVTWWSVYAIEKGMRQELLEHARIAACAINVVQVASLAGSDTDLAKTAYQQLKIQLIRMRSASSQCRFLYLMGQRPDRTIFFFVDAQLPDSKDYVPPGLVYEEVSEAYRRAFLTGKEEVVGPISDRWGRLFSALVPLKDPQKKDVITVLGMDVDASTWNRELLTRCAMPVAIILMFVILIVAMAAREQAFRARSESEEKYRTLIEESFDGIFVQKGPTIVFANRRLHEMLGYEEGELLDLDHWLIYHPDYHEVTRERAQRRLQGEQITPRYEVKLQRKDGSFFEGEVNARAIRLDEEAGIQVWVRDVTESRQAERALKESEERYRILAEQSPFAISIISPEGQYKYVNPKFVEIFGYTQADIPTGRDWFNKVFPDKTYRKQVISSWFEDLNQSLPDEMRPRIFTVRCKDGTNKIISFRSVTMQTGEYFVISDDITQRKKLESQLMQAQKMEAVGTLAGGMAHDFNNILTAITGYAELALDDSGKDGRISGHIDQILKASTRAKELIQRILTFSRKVEPELKPLDLNREVKQSVEMLKRTIPRMISIELHLSSEIDLIHGDSAQLEQMLLNLGTNARDAMPEGGRLIIETANTVLDRDYCRLHPGSSPGDYVQLSVSDTGSGIDKELLSQIFDPFFTTKEVGSGTGLGLAMVFGIVKGHGGYITCYSQAGQGTSFHIYLPAVKTEKSPEPRPVKTRPKSLTGTETILLVDDEPSLRSVASSLLTKNGYKTLLASSGEEAVEIFLVKAAEIDLVVLDIGMPGMGGHRCLQALLEIKPEAKIIIASGYSKNGALRETMALGAVDYLAKPFKTAELLETVRRVLDHSKV